MTTVDEVLAEFAREPAAPARKDPASCREVLRSIALSRVAAMRRAPASEVVAHARKAARAATRLYDDNPTEEAAEVCELAGRASSRGFAVRAAASAKGDFAAAVDVFSALDACYYRLRYLSVLLGEKVPRPHKYFCGLIDPGASSCVDTGSLRDQIAEAARGYLKRCVSKEGVKENAEIAWELVGRHKPSWNPLLRLFHARWRESAWLRTEWTSGQEPLVPTDDSTGMKVRDPVAPASLHLWRSSLRAAAHEYSYAVPSERALAALAHFAIVDVGAGTGYWARALRERGVTTRAFDAFLGPDNEYHRRYPTWTDVHCADAAHVDLTAHEEDPVAVLVCYAPPDSTMLGDVVRRFEPRTQDRLALVGEWRGDTASADCLAALLDAYCLDQRISLPNWGDTSAELTLWKSRSPDRGVEVDVCDACHEASPHLRRCRISYDIIVCSAACLAQMSRRHADILALKCCLPDVVVPDFHNPTHFRKLVSSSRRRRPKAKKARTVDDSSVAAGDIMV